MKAFRTILIIITFCFLLANTPGLAQNKLKFGTFPIPLMVESDEKGIFIDLTKAIAERSKLNIQIIVKPPKRTIKAFLEGELDSLFPALDVFFPTGIEVQKGKELIYIKKDFVFTKRGKPFLKTLQDLEGKKVGITMGYPYANELMSNNLIRLDTASKDELNAKKLIMERFDAFVVEEKSGIKAFEKTDLLNDMQYDPKVPLSRQDVYFAFQSNDEGRKLAELVSEALKEMKKDGTFAKIMSAANSN